MRKVHKGSLGGSVNIVSRAIAGIVKNPLKALILLLVIFILATVISGAISVQLAIQNTDTNLRRELPPVVSLEENHTAAMECEQETGEWPEIERLSLEQLSQIGKSSYVKNYDISVNAHLSSADIERIVGDEEMRWTEGDWESFNLSGVHSSNLVDIEEGIIEITSGRAFTEEEATALSYVALISEELAEANSLHVGSTITLENLVWDFPEDGEILDSFFIEENIFARRSYDFKVTGIFKSHAEFNTGDEWNNRSMKEEHLNRIYTSNPVSMEVQNFRLDSERERTPDDEWLQSDNEDLMWITNVYALNDSSDIEAFRESVENDLPEFWIVVDAGDSRGDIASSMENIRNLTGVVLYAAIGASVLILSLLIFLFLRERKKEIDIYLALGEKRGGVILQMMSEVLIIALIAITLALFAGNLLAGNISETMIRNDMATGQGSSSEQHVVITNLDWMGFGAEDASTEEVLATYNVALDSGTLFFFYVSAISTVVVATTIPMLYILRLNPRKILM